MNNAIHPTKVYQMVLLGLIVFLAWTIWSELGFMFPSLLGAIALYVLLIGPMMWMVRDRGMKDWLAALILMLTSAAVIIVPVWFIIKLLLNKAAPLVNSTDFFLDAFEKMNAYLMQELNLNLLTEERLLKISEMLTTVAQDLLSGTFKTGAILVFMFLFLFFMLVNSRKMMILVRRYLPFKESNNQKLIKEVERMVKSNSITIPTVAFLQGTAALAGYLIFGIREAMLLGVLTAISSVIPVAGAMLVYLPVAIYTMATGDVWPGIGMALWGFIIVGSVDNVARFILQKRLANVHPLITILGVILGTKLFGLIGIIFGPLTISLFVILVRIYFNEFGNIRGIPDLKKHGKE